MNNQLLLFFVVVCWGLPALGQQLGPDPYYQSGNGLEDLDELDREEPVKEVGRQSREQAADPEGELSLRSNEVRRLFQSAYALGIGTSEAWQNFSLHGYYFLNSDVHWGGSAGGGKWTYTGTKAGRSYELTSQSRVISGFVRYFFTDLSALYVQAGLGYVLLLGDIKPVGGDGEEDSENEAGDSLRSGFRSSGLWISQQLGWQFAWGSGFFLEVALVGFGKTWLVDKTFTRSSRDARSVVKDRLEAPYSWGLLNLKLGWMF